MKVEIKIPPAGESITEATVGTVFKENGSYVKLDEELFELETEKANQVVYAPAAGALTLSIKVHDAVKINQVVGFVDTEKAQSSQKPVPEEPKKEIKETPQPVSKKETHQPVTEDYQIRKQKEEFIEQVKQPIAVQKTVSPEGEPRETRKKMSKMRTVIAKRLVESKNQTAMLTTFNEVDMSAVIEVREKEQENFQKRHGVKLGFMSFFIKACTSALQRFPDINAYIDLDQIVYRNYIDIGVAVGSEKGLFVPVIRNCDKLSFAAMEKSLKELSQKAKEGKISVDEMQGGGFTISNGGVYGSLLSTPILNPPQSGILGMHSIVKRPVVVDDQIVIRPMMYLALSYDHRIVDGKTSIEFLIHIKNHLEDPRRFLLDL